MTRQPPPKYAQEFWLQYQSCDRFLFRASDVTDLDCHLDGEVLSRLNQCQIYFIGTRPRVGAVPGSLRRSADELVFTLEYAVRGQVRRRQVAAPVDLFGRLQDSFSVSPYPHRDIVATQPNGELAGSCLIANYAHILGLPPEASDLEILYIGQGMHASAKDRLINHATLQKVLAKIASNEPDCEVFLLVHAFAAKKPMVGFPRDMPPEITGLTADRRRHEAIAIKPSKTDQVALIEAACIAYFQTSEYNTHFLSFPEGKMKALTRLKPADFAGLHVQLDHTGIGGLRIGSKSVSPANNHEIIVDFRNGKHMSPLSIAATHFKSRSVDPVA